MSGQPRAIVNRNLCVGSGWCTNLAPGAFAIDTADGKARVVDPDGATPDELDEAADSCPVAAITLEGGTE